VLVQTCGVARLRPLIHLAAGCAVIGLALAVGRWLRDPEPGGPLLAILALAAVIALAARRLYRPGGLGRRPPAAEPALVAPVVPAPAAPPPPLWMTRERLRPPVTASDDLRATLHFLNSAGVTELQTLPGVGKLTAERIVGERERGGPFATVEDLARVGGLGPGRIRALSKRVKTS
jgi:competence ComEA-like helix-hairpin-helix protein